MPQVAVIGAQWGDEAKGKIVHFLAREAELAVRFNGGPNAGHTVQDAYGTVQLHLVPAGALQPGCAGVIAHGVVVDPQVLEEELDEIRRQGRPEVALYLSDRAHLILPHHRIVEELEGTARRIGTTRRGIGPAYQDRVARRGLRLGDLADPELVLEYLTELEAALKGRYGKAGFVPKQLADRLARFYATWKERIVDSRAVVARALAEGQLVIFEGAQGTLLDLDLGTYPYVTSSTTTVHGIGWGVGVRLSEGARVIGVSKAYTTRVGEGPFPTEDTGEGGDLLRQKGREYGATTGRPRRCGWLDLVALRYAQEVNSFTELAITKLDVLSGLDEIPVCTAYDLEGEKVEVLPRTLAELSAARPHYERLPGWKEDIRKARTPSDLPREARSYIAFVEEVLGVPVTMAGVGPGEDELVVLR